MDIRGEIRYNQCSNSNWVCHERNALEDCCVADNPWNKGGDPMKRCWYLAMLLVLVTSAARGQSWYGLQEHGLEPNYRDQDGFGTCWAFGTMASVETNLIKQGLLPQNTAGLSERDLAWHSGYSGSVDPMNGGGSYMFSAAYFARGDGPLLETQAPYWNTHLNQCLMGSDPYPNSTTPSPLPRSSRPTASYYVRDIDWLHSTADIKNAVLTYGAVSTCWAVNTGTWYGASGHWNASSTYQAASAGDGQPNHSVAIVGWDDNWVTAGGTGAWLIRNSWGTGTQHFGMSYNDFYAGHDSPDVGAQNMGAVSFHDVVPNTYQKIYYHNDLGWTGQQPHSYAFNHFTADRAGSLKSVSFYTTDDSIGYTVKIYKQFQNGVLGQLATTTSGTMIHEGFHTIDLPSLVGLSQGQDFYIELQTSNGLQAHDGNTNVTVVTGGSADPYVTTTALPGQSYFSDNGTTWTDLQTVNASANFAITGLTIVPEPSSIALLAALAVCGLGYAASRRRRRRG
jgi:C1A family cysteine protease